MTDQKKITRASLYDLQSDYESDGSEYVAPQLDLEFIEVEPTPGATTNDEAKKATDPVEEAQDDEFEFPLFASAMEVDTKPVEEERGRSNETGIMKVSLREQSEERVVNERPESYYFAKYTDMEKQQFEACCVTGEDIYKQLCFVDTQPWKCLDLNKYNAKIEIEIRREKERTRKHRPGKKKREVRVACHQRKLERAKAKQKEEEEKKRQLKKQKYLKKSFGKGSSGAFQKRKQKPVGGKTKQLAKPKYRTE
ncbi:hypothetical protein Cantr_10071 [Candida viswanathii]|uniref:Uncharacterized protein n=1 Tax=Candida viswanathii TaxID=5486 RepID=A0A367YF17_9ASCO|nr:hypothetical protein Cantr_10071 [Candida viswanathii]